MMIKKVFILHTSDQSSESYRWRLTYDNGQEIRWAWFMEQLMASELLPAGSVVENIEVFDDTSSRYVPMPETVLVDVLSTALPRHLLLHLQQQQRSEEPIMIAGRCFDIVHDGLPIGDAGSRVLVQEVSAASLGTGLISWDGSVVLAKYLELHNELIKAKQVLEVGAGTGVSGIAAALLGAEHVLLTDLQYSLSNLQANIQLNLHSNDVLEASRISSAHLDWMDPSTYPRHVILGMWDVILGADVVWLEELVPALAHTLAACSGTNTVILIAHQTRSLRTDNVLFEELTKAGLSFEQVPRMELHPDYSPANIHILRIRRRAVQETQE